MNPIAYAIDQPAAAFADAGLILLLVGALVLTWWAIGRNGIAIYAEVEQHYGQSGADGWGLVDPPLIVAARVAAVFVLLALDFWIIGAAIAAL